MLHTSSFTLEASWETCVDRGLYSTLPPPLFLRGDEFFKGTSRVVVYSPNIVINLLRNYKKLNFKKGTISVQRLARSFGTDKQTQMVCSYILRLFFTYLPHSTPSDLHIVSTPEIM